MWAHCLLLVPTQAAGQEATLPTEGDGFPAALAASRGAGLSSGKTTWTGPMASARAEGSGPAWQGACVLATALLWLCPLLLRAEPEGTAADGECGGEYGEGRQVPPPLKCPSPTPPARRTSTWLSGALEFLGSPSAR